MTRDLADLPISTALALIDWIWDEFQSVSRYGQSYSEHFRPTAPERMQDTEKTSID